MVESVNDFAEKMTPIDYSIRLGKDIFSVRCRRMCNEEPMQIDQMVLNLERVKFSLSELSNRH